KGYFLDVVDEITKQIVREIDYLFDDCKKDPALKKDCIIFKISNEKKLNNEGYYLRKVDSNLVIEANSTNGLLYGLYRVYKLSVLNIPLQDGKEYIPDQSIRMINHWDNMDGTIERGYAGESIFFKNNSFRRDFRVVEQYARLLASVGINALSINNVNVHEVETEL